MVKLTPNALTVGADCAGMGSGIEAALRVCPSANIVFASEKDDETRAHLLNNFYIGDQMSDVSSRPARFDQHVDLYICGFPCQPYSSAGLRLGLDDERSSVVHRIVDFLKKARPEAFLLENVRGFLSANNGEAFNEIVNSINAIKGPGVLLSMSSTTKC